MPDDLPRRRLMPLIVADVIATIPFAGFFVHAARHDQAVGLVILLAWAVAVVWTLVAVVRLIARPTAQRGVRVATAYLALATAVGGFGAREAFLELIAG